MEPIPLDGDGERYDAQARLKEFLDDDAWKGRVHGGVTDHGELWG